MTVGFRQQFEKELRQLKDPILKKRILKAIVQAENAAALPDIPNLWKLVGYETYYRIRIGDYRLGLKWEADDQTLYFVTFAHRKDIYTDFPVILERSPATSGILTGYRAKSVINILTTNELEFI